MVRPGDMPPSSSSEEEEEEEEEEVREVHLGLTNITHQPLAMSQLSIGCHSPSPSPGLCH